MSTWKPQTFDRSSKSQKPTTMTSQQTLKGVRLAVLVCPGKPSYKTKCHMALKVLPMLNSFRIAPRFAISSGTFQTGPSCFHMYDVTMCSCISFISSYFPSPSNTCVGPIASWISCRATKTVSNGAQAVFQPPVSTCTFCRGAPQSVIKHESSTKEASKPTVPVVKAGWCWWGVRGCCGEVASMWKVFQQGKKEISTGIST